MAHGCSTYSRPPAALSSSPIAATALVDRPARRWRRCGSRPPGPSASRTASSRACRARGSAPARPPSPSRSCSRRRATIAARLLRADRRNGHVDRHVGRARARASPRSAASRAARSQGWRRAGVVLQEGAELPPARAPPEQHALAGRDAAEAAAASGSSRRELRRADQLPSAPRAVHLAVGAARGSSSTTTSARGAHVAGLAPGRAARRATRRTDHDGDDLLAPLGVGDADHLDRAHARVLASSWARPRAAAR